MKAAIISALVASVISAGSATAAFVVTSKNIKNGTIQLADISPRAKATLRGQRGLRGPQGPQGDHGLVGTTQVSGDSVTLQPGEQGLSVATWTQGKVTGGGWGGVNSSSLVVLRSFPSTELGPYPNETWTVIAVNRNPTSTENFFARAICAY